MNQTIIDLTLRVTVNHPEGYCIHDVAEAAQTMTLLPSTSVPGITVAKSEFMNMEPVN